MAAVYAAIGCFPTHVDWLALINTAGTTAKPNHSPASISCKTDAQY